ncbi:MAG: FAD-dependent oxidoreductase, partial [Pseudomonadota bacterium]
MSNPDVVVIGAGAAGVGAGIELRERGVDCLILDGANRVGGRAFTDTRSLPRAWDHGCHWFHSADVNPLVPWADRLGTTYAREVWGDSMMIWTEGVWEGSEAVDEAEDALDAVYDAVEAAAGDPAMSEVMPDGGRWARGIRCVIQQLHSVDPEQISCIGSNDYSDTDVNWPVLSGYGDLIARMAKDLPIRLECPVTGVAETAAGVRVETASGPIDAKSAIVTASTNVLRSGAITIGPGPARDLLDLIETVPCGSYEKVAVALKTPLVDGADKRFCEINPGPSGPVVDFQIVPGDAPMMIAHLAGGMVRGLDADARTAIVLERLEMAFGSRARDQILATATTEWETNPLIRGAYSCSVPGSGQKRHEMIAADTGRIAFAGEAFSLKWQATAHGAYQSGRDVASRMA